MPDYNTPIMNKENVSLEEMLDRLAAEAQVRRLAQRDGADLNRWCCRRRQRRATLRRGAVAVCILAMFASSSGTIMAQMLPDCKMNVSQPFMQQYMHKRTTEMIALL